MTIQKINGKLQIVNLRGKKFKDETGYYQYSKGYAFYAPELGYMAFSDSPLFPYSPSKKALQSILNAGGMVNFSLNVWVKELI